MAETTWYNGLIGSLEPRMMFDGAAVAAAAATLPDGDAAQDSGDSSDSGTNTDVQDTAEVTDVLLDDSHSTDSGVQDADSSGDKPDTTEQTEGDDSTDTVDSETVQDAEGTAATEEDTEESSEESAEESTSTEDQNNTTNDNDSNATDQDTAGSVDENDTTDQDGDASADDNDAADQETETVTVDDVLDQNDESAAFDTVTIAPGEEVAFVDSRVEEYQQLVDTISSEMQVFVVDGDVDGFAFMAETVQDSTDISAVHILGHGESGSLTLGNTTLDGENLDQYDNQLESIGSALSENGDILLYGCNIGEGDSGLDFISSLSELTDADVAASDDTTGDADQGGDWDLEQHVGDIDAEPLSIDSFAGILGLPGARSETVSTSNGDEVFLGGNYIEIGIHYSGSYGTSSSAPGTFFGTSSSSNVGLSNDADGYNVGTDLRIDYFLPGTPAEGFAIGVNGTSYENYGLCGDIDISEVTVTDTSSGDTLSATVEFTVDGLHVAKTISFGVNDTFFSTEVTMTNTTGDAMTDVRYIRGFDPDNTQFYGGDYTTINTIQQTIADDGLAVVSATSQPDNYSTANDGNPATILFFSDDSRAMMSIGSESFEITDAYGSALMDNAPLSTTSDVGISIGIEESTLAAGDSTTFIFYTSLDDASVEDTIATISAASSTAMETSEDTAIDFQATDFQDAEGSSYSQIQITDLPDHGTLSLDGEDITTLNYVVTTPDALNYTPDGDYNGDDSFSWQGWDSVNSQYTGDVATDIRVLPVNDAPVLDAVSGDTISDTAASDDFSVVNGTISARDIDSSSLTYTVSETGATSSGGTSTFQGAYGTLSVISSTGAYSYTPADTSINALIEGTSVTDTFTIMVSDGDGGTDTTELAFSITGVDDTMIVGGTIQTLEYTENQAPTPIDTAITLTDPDPTGWNGGYLEVEITGNGAVEDQLVVASAGLIAVSGSDITYAGTVIGTIDSSLDGADNTSLHIDLNSSATTTAVQALGRTIAYSNSSDDPSTADRTVTFTFNDGGNNATGTALEVDRTATITISAVDDPAELTLSETAGGEYIENDTGFFLDPNLTITDIDSTTMDAARVIITTNFNSSEDSLFAEGDNITGSAGSWSFAGTSGTIAMAYDSATDVMTLSGEASVEDYQAALRSITYQNFSDNPDTSARNVSMIPGSADSTAGGQTLTITPVRVNDTPDISGTGTTSFSEVDGALTGSGTLTVNDPDTEDTVLGTVSGVTVSGTYNEAAPVPEIAVLQSMLSIGATTVLSSTADNGNLSWSFNSDSENFDWLARGETLVLTYAIDVSDDSATESGGSSLSDSQSLAITITGTNDAPVIRVGEGDSSAENLSENDAPLTVGSTLSVVDLDTSDVVEITTEVAAQQYDSSGEEVVSTVQQPDNESLLAMLNATSPAIDGSGQAGAIEWSFDSGRGVLEQAFDYLAEGERLELTYTLTATDSQGAIDNHSVTIAVTGTNDAPTISIGENDNATAELTETDSALSSLGSVTISDLDTPNIVTVTTDVSATQFSSTGNVMAADGSQPSYEHLLAMFDATDEPINNSSQTGTIAWSFNSSRGEGTESFDYLAAGEQLVLNYTVTATDSEGAIAEQVVTVTITGTNDAPELVSVDAMLDTINEDMTGNDGQTVADILDVTDIDTTDLHGIAVFGADADNGTWQYSTNGGRSWSNFGQVSVDSALLLGENDMVRFMPNGDNGAAPSFAYKAWDQSEGSSGSRVDVSHSGGSTPFSENDATANITVDAVNDEPTTAGSISDQSAGEGDPWSFSVGSNLFADIDAGDRLTYSVSGLPEGVSFDGGSLSFRGTPTTPGLYTIIITATDSSGATTAQYFSLTVVEAPKGPVVHDSVILPQVVPTETPGSDLPSTAQSGLEPTLTGNQGNESIGGVEVSMGGNGDQMVGGVDVSLSGDTDSLLGEESAAGSDGVAEGDAGGQGDNLPGMFGDAGNNAGAAGGEKIDNHRSENIQVSTDGQVIWGEDHANQVIDGLFVKDLNIESDGFTMEVSDTAGNGMYADYTVTLKDSVPLPDWVRITSKTGTITITGTPPAGTDSLELEITSIDSDGNTKILEVTIKFNASGQPVAANGHDLFEASDQEIFLPLTQQLTEAVTYENYGEDIVNALVSA